MKDHRLHVIYPPHSRLKVECRVYDTRRAMLAAIRKDDPSGIANDTYAFCATDKIPTGHLAVIYFCKPHIGHDHIVHELVHAGLALLARRKVKEIPVILKSNAAAEEQLAQIVGGLVSAFHRGFAIK